MFNKNLTGANFNRDTDGYTLTFLDQLQSQFWLPQEIAMAPDLAVWRTLPEDVKDAYAKNLQILTFLDTHQGDLGMATIAESLSEDEHLKKATFMFMTAFENSIHARSYSTIYQTYLSSQEIDQLFTWGEENPHLQKVLKTIVSEYENLEKMIYKKKYTSEIITDTDYKKAQWKAMASSVLLETFLFYTGFYYPLWFYGQGKLMQAGEIINLIIRDEVVHGLYTGTVAQGIYKTLPAVVQDGLKVWLDKTLETLYQTEIKLIEEIYTAVGLTHDVKKFIRYNANKAYMNLGFDQYFDDEEINPVVLRGLDTESKTMDFFSMKGNSYQKMVVESVKDDDFDFTALDKKMEDLD